MNKRDIVKLKKQIEKEKEGLVQTVNDLEKEYNELSKSHPIESIENISYNQEWNYISRRLNRERKKIKVINDALKRIEDGEYGKCKKCGEIIDSYRLFVIPTTLYCSNCAYKGEDIYMSETSKTKAKKRKLKSKEKARKKKQKAKARKHKKTKK